MQKKNLWWKLLLTIDILLIIYINAHRSAYEREQKLSGIKNPLKANKFFYFNLEQDLKPQQCIGTTTTEITNSIHLKPKKKKRINYEVMLLP